MCGVKMTERAIWGIIRVGFPSSGDFHLICLVKGLGAGRGWPLGRLLGAPQSSGSLPGVFLGLPPSGPELPKDSYFRTCRSRVCVFPQNLPQCRAPVGENRTL